MNGASECQTAENPRWAPFGGEFAEGRVALKVSSVVVVVAAVAGAGCHWFVLIGPTEQGQRACVIEDVVVAVQQNDEEVVAC